MMQNFMAEAATTTQNPAGRSTNQGYNAYPGHAAYASPHSNTGGQPGHAAPGPDFGLAAYDNSYGY